MGLGPRSVLSSKGCKRSKTERWYHLKPQTSSFLNCKKKGRRPMAKFCVNRPIVAMVISIVTVLAGLVSMSKLPLAQFPSIVPPQIIVNTTFTGGDATTIEQSVATPLEQQLNAGDN